MPGTGSRRGRTPFAGTRPAATASGPTMPASRWGQGFLSRQEEARSRGLGLPAGAPPPGGLRPWVTREAGQRPGPGKGKSIAPENGENRFLAAASKGGIVSHASSAKLDELHLRNSAESRADNAESRNGKRLQHHSSFQYQPDRNFTVPIFKFRL